LYALLEVLQLAIDTPLPITAVFKLLYLFFISGNSTPLFYNPPIGLTKLLGGEGEVLAHEALYYWCGCRRLSSCSIGVWSYPSSGSGLIQDNMKELQE